MDSQTNNVNPCDSITSPRKLQEMTSPDGNGDVTSVSGISMKKYEDQLIGLRKENFNLKLRVYFLEERLGSGAPPAVQGLLEHNVRLQVELEELKRQLNEKQDLLAAAAKVIDALEQQGSVSMDSEDCSSTDNAFRGQVKHLDMQTETEDSMKLAETDNPPHCSTTNEEDGLDSMKADMQNETSRLKQEHLSACQMIGQCMKRMQQQERQIKKLQKNQQIMESSTEKLTKYEDILKCKEEHIQDLENKLKELQAHGMLQNEQDYERSSSKNLQELLTKRLQGLAFFLDRLLSHKCVLGEEKKRLAKSLLEQSLALPVGLQLDETMAPTELTMDESGLDVSQVLNLEDLTLMFGHHNLCDVDGDRVERKCNSTWPLHADAPSESECWSEPDRNVSLARIGLKDVKIDAKVNSSDEPRHKARRNRSFITSRVDESDRRLTLENGLREELNSIKEEKEYLEENLRCQLENDKIKSKEIEKLREQITLMQVEKDKLSTVAEEEKNKNRETCTKYHLCLQKLEELEIKCKHLETSLEASVENVNKLRSDFEEKERVLLLKYNEAEERFNAVRDTERSLQRQLDEAALQASQAALERTRSQHERMKAESETEHLRVQVQDADRARREAEIKIITLEDKINEMHIECDNLQKKMLSVQGNGSSEEELRSTSPDQGIDSDRLSSLELTDGNQLSLNELISENKILRQKLARTKSALADTLGQLGASNTRKKRVQLAICREIHKTQGVLRQARDRLESHQ